MIKKKLIYLVLIVLIIQFPAAVLSADIGGEFKTSLSGLLNEDGELDLSLQEKLNLELFMPARGNTEGKFEVDFLNSENGLNLLVKKIYLRQRFESFDITVGRQPVSWSFGSLLNPVDYNLGSEVMNEEQAGKYQDAVEFFVPFSWNSNLSLVASDSRYSDEIKWGLRGRKVYRGFDLTLNYVQEPELDISGQLIDASNRLGFTFKGDAGKAGIYGALGHYLKDNESSISYLAGVDYSINVGYDKKINLQIEYLNIATANASSVMGLSQISWSDKERIQLLLGNTGYDIDEFSRVGLMLVSSLDDNSILLIPTYQNQLANNLEFTLRGSIFIGSDDTIFGPRIIGPDDIEKTTGSIEASLSYPF